ncbi:GntR family transcriptional regulator [Azospirillum sp. SYSU D00513]|uniref:GntR family transcriptional regulator n=1 Tax=Azospirillum sp. SYSU D00513 TaxID=2812561 RepID=UPI001A95B417|nr:GntR family transcriptional regulator [Azospirillum sp. SYSU D00513]
MDGGKTGLPTVTPEALRRRGRASVKPRIAPIARPPSLTEVAADRLRTLIIEGELPFGRSLSEQQLAALLRVSKTPVREALAQLKAEGLVLIQPHKGTFVFTPDLDEVTPLCEHWATLASSALRFAMDREPEELAASITEALAALQAAREAGDARGAIRAEMEAYAAPFRHCSNPYLVEAQRLIASRIMAMRMHAGRSDDSLDAVYRQVEEFAAEVRSGAAEAAVERLNARIGRVAALLKAVLLTAASRDEAGEGRTVGTTNVAFLMSVLQGEQLLALAQDVCAFMI